MHYETRNNNHGLLYDPFKALVVPRPIGWVTTVNTDGVLNVAPYSFFNGVSDKPPMVMFSVFGRKDSLINIEATGDCTCSFATRGLADAMNVTSAPVAAEVNEFDLTELTQIESQLVSTPRIGQSPAALECRHFQSVPLPGVAENPDAGYTLVLAEVVAIYINDDYINDGIVDTGAMQPLARLGYMEYMAFDGDNVFTINRPVVDDAGTGIAETNGEWDGVYR